MRARKGTTKRKATVAGKRPSTRRKAPQPAIPPPDRLVHDQGRAAAVKLLIEGHTNTSAARVLGVDRHTVAGWAREDGVREQLAEARKLRDLKADEAAEAARRVLREHAELASEVLVDKLSSRVPGEADRAARSILDRVGVPRTVGIEHSGRVGVDLGKLSTEAIRAARAAKKALEGG